MFYFKLITYLGVAFATLLSSLSWLVIFSGNDILTDFYHGSEVIAVHLMEHVSSYRMDTLRIFEVRFALSKDVFQCLNCEIIVSKLNCQLYGDLTIHRQVIALVFVMILWFHFRHFSKNKT